MAVKWNPGGFLDLAMDPTDLPEEAGPKTVESGAMTRCTNLALDRLGMARTRWGSRALSSALATPISKIVHQGADRYTFGTSAIYRNETALTGTFAATEWDAFSYNAYNATDLSVFATNGTDRVRIDDDDVEEWGLDAPEDAYSEIQADAYTHDWEDDHATNGVQITREHDDYDIVHLFNWEFGIVEGKGWVPPSDTWGKVGTSWHDSYASYAEERQITHDDFDGHGVRYTYARYDGDALLSESNPSPEFTVDFGVGGIITWPLAADSQVTHVRVYTTLDKGATYLWHSTHPVADRAAQIYKQATALGTQIAWDHDRPPTGATVAIGPSLNGQCFMAVGNLLYFCKPQQPEYWPLSYYVEVGPPAFPIISLTFWNGQLYALTAVEIYLVQGAGEATYFPLPMKAVTGTVHRDAVWPIQGRGIYHLGNDGIYLFNGATDQNVSSSRLKPIFEGEEAGGVPGVDRSAMSSCRLSGHRNRLYFAYPGAMLVFDDGGQIAHYDYGLTWVYFDLDKANEELVAAASNGRLYRIENESDLTDDGDAIEWEVRSKDFVLHRLHFPRVARWEVDVGAGATCHGQVILDDTVKHTHVVNGSRNIKRRLVQPCNGQRLAIGLVGEGRVKIYGAEVE
jgi:hypothetical protein